MLAQIVTVHIRPRKFSYEKVRCAHEFLMCTGCTEPLHCIADADQGSRIIPDEMKGDLLKIADRHEEALKIIEYLGGGFCKCEWCETVKPNVDKFLNRSIQIENDTS